MEWSTVLGVGGKYWDKQGWQRPVHIALTGVSKTRKSKITTNSSNSTTPLHVPIFSPSPEYLYRGLWVSLSNPPHWLQAFWATQRTEFSRAWCQEFDRLFPRQILRKPTNCVLWQRFIHILAPRISPETTGATKILRKIHPS